MAAHPKHDYQTMRAEFIQTDISLRALAIKYDANPSVVSRKAGADDWLGLREAYRAKVVEKSVEIMANRRAAQVEQIGDDFLNAVQAAVNRLTIDLSDRWEQDPETGNRVFVRARPVNARDISLLIEKMQVLMGQPGSISRNEGVVLTGDLGELPLDMARDLLRASEAAGAGTGTAHQSPLPRAQAPRPVN